MVPVQDGTETVVLTTDADWATCRASRRSNSGGTLQLGDHLIAAWSRVQPRIALSSGAAELCAGTRGISETLGFVHMMREFKTNDWGRIVHRVDASACRAIMLRRGCGGLKHITFKSLWVQEAVREYSIEIERISRDEMHAHIFASPSSAEELRKHLTELLASENWQRRPSVDVGSVPLDGIGTILTAGVVQFEVKLRNDSNPLLMFGRTNTRTVETLRRCRNFGPAHAYTRKHANTQTRKPQTWQTSANTQTSQTPQTAQTRRHVHSHNPHNHAQPHTTTHNHTQPHGDTHKHT